MSGLLHIATNPRKNVPGAKSRSDRVKRDGHESFLLNEWPKGDFRQCHLTPLLSFCYLGGDYQICKVCLSMKRT